LNAEQARPLQTFAVATEEADEATAEPLP
jgi:hypothetical protein